jgi:uncharacterized membrane protein YeaQ/YmgE (transglycosylase-associated protein family)
MNIIVVIVLAVIAIWVTFALLGSLVSALLTVLAGALIGWLASMVMGTNRQMGALANVIAGLVGAWVGGMLSRLLGLGAYGAGFHPLAIVFGVIGACIVIAIYRAVTGGGRTATLR